MAGSTFRSQNTQMHTRFGPRFEVEMSKNARDCGAKHVSKSKCTKHLSVGALLEVEISKSGRRCGGKHISKSKNTQHSRFGPLFEVEMSKKVHAVVTRSAFPSQNVKSTACSDNFWAFRCRFAWQVQGIVHLVKNQQNVRVL